jgi:DNA-directed RNA polymerase subunit RPC12/RpoP
MKLEELKQAYLAGEITHMSMTHKLKLVSSELNQLYPQQGELLWKFRAYVHGGTNQDSWCDHSQKFRRLISFEEGFRPFCGNQSTCACNKLHQQQVKAARTPEQKVQITQKRIVTTEQKYGVPFASQNDLIKAKAAQTCMVRYGAKAATLNPAILEKGRQTVQQNWGVDYVQQHPEIRAKTKQVFESEYGASCPSQNDHVKQKTKDTNLVKYGVSAPFLQEDVLALTREIFRAQSYETQVQSQNQFEPQFTRDAYIKGSPEQEYDFKCVTCGHAFKSLVKAQVTLRCYECHPKRETWG